MERVCWRESALFSFPITMRLKHSSIKHCKLSKSSSSFSRVLKSIQICLPVLFLLLFKDVRVNWQRKLVTEMFAISGTPCSMLQRFSFGLLILQHSSPHFTVPSIPVTYHRPSNQNVGGSIPSPYNLQTVFQG